MNESSPNYKTRFTNKTCTKATTIYDLPNILHCSFLVYPTTASYFTQGLLPLLGCPLLPNPKVIISLPF